MGISNTRAWSDVYNEGWKQKMTMFGDIFHRFDFWEGPGYVILYINEILIGMQ